MDLKKRLAQLDRLSRRPVGAGSTSTAAVITPEQIRDTLRLLCLEERNSSLGSHWVRNHVDLVPTPEHPLPDMNEIFSRAGDFLPAPGKILFLDTETTGLAGGTGTIPFLVGVSWWADAGFETRQFFLPAPGHETAMLENLADMATGFDVVVTFNGASFDLPLLRTRARLNRLADPLADLQVWDLLVPSRRLWGHRLPDCRQQTLEQEVCGLDRQTGDIEGSRIPQTWFDFLADGRPGMLPRVLTHNHRDMVGMGQLFLKVVAAAGYIDGGRGWQGILPWDEAWALGRICERRRDTGRAISLMKAAADCGPRRARGNGRFLADAIRIIKRSGDWKFVELLISSGLQEDLDDPWLHREAAILYEHRLVNFRLALDHALESGDDHRVARLQRLVDPGYPGS